MAKPDYDCTTCNHFFKVGPMGGGQCRRDPPVPVMFVVGAEINKLTGQQQPLIHAQIIWPGVDKTVWCSSHPLARPLPMIGEINRNRPSGPSQPLQVAQGGGMPLPEPPHPSVLHDPVNRPEPTLEEVPGIMDEPRGKA